MRFKPFLPILLSIVVISCGGSQVVVANTPQTSVASSSQVSAVPSTQTFEATGSGSGFIPAKQAAYVKAMEKALKSMLGDATFNKYKSDLSSLLNYRAVLKFVKKGKIVDHYRSGRNLYITARVTFKMDKLKRRVDSMLEGKPRVSEARRGGTTTSSPSGQQVKVQASEEVPLDKLSRYTFLVYYSKRYADNPPPAAKWAVLAANRYLAQNGLDYIELDQIEKLKSERAAIIEEAQGEMSIAQVIAQRLHADIYIEVESASFPTTEEMADYYCANASVNLKAFESSTGRGLGSSMAGSKRLCSRAALTPVKKYSMEVAVKKAMDDLMKTVARYSKEGVRLVVKIIGVKNYRQERKFIRLIKNVPGVKSADRVSGAKGVAEYTIYFEGGRAEEFLDGVFSATEGIDEFENLDVEESRGNEIILKLK